MSSNTTIIFNGDQIFVDELVRENARLTVQHEVDRQELEALRARVAEMTDAKEALEACGRAQERARIAEAKLSKLTKDFNSAVQDLHAVMAGGDPCEKCGRTCLMGEGNCEPEWRGLKKAGDGQ